MKPPRGPVHAAAGGMQAASASASASVKVGAALAIASAWSVYLPLGLQYACYVLAALLASLAVWQTRRWGDLLRNSVLWATGSLWLLLFVSMVWSTAPRSDIASHLWHYGRLLWVPVIALACAPQIAQRGLRHFVAASALVGALIALEALNALPPSPLWSSTVTASGNQRIATSMLLALGATLALAQAVDRVQPRLRRALWLSAAVVTMTGLALQDRRTGLLALPVLLALLAATHQRSWRRAIAWLGGVVVLAVLAWNSVDGIKGRFVEGWAELRSYQSSGVVDTSWGMRVRMATLTMEMVRDRPLLGHGIGSWLGLWQARAQGGGRLLEEQLTPHNEYLLIAEQVGLIGLSLWFAVLATHLTQAWRAGRTGDASLLIWTTIAWSALFNVVVRDAKFAVPMLLLAALAQAAYRNDPEGRTEVDRSGRR